MQQRVIAITDQKIYVLKNEKLRSTIPILDVMGLTKPDPPTEEVGIHMR